MRTVTRRSLHAVLNIVIVVAFGLVPIVVLSQVQKDEWAGGSDEAWTRKTAIKKVMPIYPEEALRLGISGHVEVKIAITEEGEVARIKVRPRTDPRLKAAVANAVKQWKFKPRRDQGGLGRPILSHLTFNFVASEGRVELHTPGPDAPDSERLGYYNSAKEYRQWREWEEVDLSQGSQNGGNRDGVITANDVIFSSLRLWRDSNHNGVSEPSELHALPALGIAKIDLDYRESRRRDMYGNSFRYRAKVHGTNSSDLGRWAWDVFLVAGP